MSTLNVDDGWDLLRRQSRIRVLSPIMESEKGRFINCTILHDSRRLQNNVLTVRTKIRSFQVVIYDELVVSLNEPEIKYSIDNPKCWIDRVHQ